METIRTIFHNSVAIEKKEDGKYYVSTATYGFQYLRDAKAHIEMRSK